MHDRRPRPKAEPAVPEAWVDRCDVPSGSVATDDRQDVAERVLEPGDIRALAADDALVVRLHPVRVVVLELDPGAAQLVDRALDITDHEVQDREDGRLVIRLRVDDDGSLATLM